MINKLLVPTDFSEQAMYALEVAVKLAKKYDATIYLLHLLEMPELLVDGPGLQNTSELPEALYFMRLAHKKFDELLSSPMLQGIDVKEAAEFHGAFEGIMDYVGKYNIDLIVMGSHGASGIEEFFIGSNTEKVVRYAKIPVLVIKSQNPDFKLKTIVFATDLQDDNVGAAQKVLDLAKAENALLKFVYINTPATFKTSNEINNEKSRFMEALGSAIDNFTVYNDNSVEAGILNFAETSQADLIGLGTHGRKGLAHFFNGSVSQDLVNHAKRPVITFKI